LNEPPSSALGLESRSLKASELPALAQGWQCGFLLFVDSWVKAGDANTPFSQTVEPVPYHEMPQDPYTSPHVYPQDGMHQRYLEFYNTRSALRRIRPLHEYAATTRATISSRIEDK
jgi:hypothetical protein